MALPKEPFFAARLQKRKKSVPFSFANSCKLHITLKEIKKKTQVLLSVWQLIAEKICIYMGRPLNSKTHDTLELSKQLQSPYKLKPVHTACLV